MKIILTVFLITVMASYTASAQDNRVIRIAKIKIDAAYIDEYKAAVKEQAETAVRVEQGVITLYAVHDKKDPTNVTVFEIYANQAAYQSHIQNRAFQKIQDHNGEYGQEPRAYRCESDCNGVQMTADTLLRSVNKLTLLNLEVCL
ncbi:MAG: putative quinol monooxygenase [Bacteroidota bacterium]